MAFSRLAPLVAVVLAACGGAPKPKSVPEPAPVADLYIDLAALQPGNPMTVSIGPGLYRLHVVHMVPTGRYEIRLRTEQQSIPPLKVDAIETQIRLVEEPESSRATREEIDAACDTLQAASDALAKSTSHAEVRTAVDALQLRLATSLCTANSIGSGAAEINQRALSLIARTQSAHDTVDLRRGETLVAEIVRVGTNETWMKSFDTGSRGEWRTTYGFTFVPKLSGSWGNFSLGPKTYFAEAGAENSYTVSEVSNRQWLEFVPTLYFHWSPTETQNAWTHSWMAGLGFDFQAPVLLFGRSHTWNENLTLGYGAGFHQRQVLLGRYRPNEEIRENLGTEELHEDAYRPALFLSIALRSLSNPFQRRVEMEQP